MGRAGRRASDAPRHAAGGDVGGRDGAFIACHQWAGARGLDVRGLAIEKALADQCGEYGVGCSLVVDAAEQGGPGHRLQGAGCEVCTRDDGLACEAIHTAAKLGVQHRNECGTVSHRQGDRPWCVALVGHTGLAGVCNLACSSTAACTHTGSVCE